MSQLSLHQFFRLTPAAVLLLTHLSLSGCQEEKKKEPKAKPAAVAGDTGGAGPAPDFPGPIKGPLASSTPRISALPAPNPNMTFIPGVGWQPVGGNTLPAGQPSCVCAQYLPPYNPWTNMLPTQGRSFGARGCQGKIKKGSMRCHAGRNKRKYNDDSGYGGAQDQQVAMLTQMVNQLLVTQGAGTPVNFGQSYNWGGMAAGVPAYAPVGGAFPNAGGAFPNAGGAFPNAGGVLGGGVPIGGVGYPGGGVPVDAYGVPIGGGVPAGGVAYPGAGGMPLGTCPMPGTVNPANGIGCQLWIRAR